MSIQSEIDRIEQAVSDTYDVLESEGATMPETRNVANLAATAADIKAVQYGKAQSLSDSEKQQARANIGAGTSSFSGSYNDLTNKPTIPSAYTHPSSHPASMITGLATVATSGSYNDLTNKPTIPSAYSHPESHPASMITGLATVATSGSYNDLSNKPTIPSAYSHPNTHAASMISAGTFAGQVVANSSGQAPGTSLLRNSKIVAEETTPTVNGEIFWVRG